MLVAEEKNYIFRKEDYAISFDGQFIFSDVDDWDRQHQERKEVKVTQGNQLIDCKTNIGMGTIVPITAIISRQQMAVLGEYYDNNRHFMLLFTNTKAPSMSFKYSDCTIDNDPRYAKGMSSIADILITLTFLCTPQEPA